MKAAPVISRIVLAAALIISTAAPSLADSGIVRNDIVDSDDKPLAKNDQ